MKIFKYVWLYFLALATLQAHAFENLVSKRIEPVHVQRLGLPSVLRDVANQTKVIFGLEADVVMGKEKMIDFVFEGGTVADLATKCASLLDNGAWKVIDNRSIIIMQPGKASSLAFVHIQYPRLAQVTRREMWSDIASRPEISNWMQSSGCRRLDLLRGYEWRGDQPSITIPSGLTTLGEALETAAFSSNLYYWSILVNSREGQCETNITLW